MQQMKVAREGSEVVKDGKTERNGFCKSTSTISIEKKGDNRNSLSGVAESIGRLSEGLASVFKEGVCQTFVFKFPADEEVQEYGK